MPSLLRIRCISSATSASLSAHQPRPALNDRNAAAKAPVSLRQFEPDIAATEHDQVRRQIIEL
jgi:hypothetical protein